MILKGCAPWVSTRGSQAACTAPGDHLYAALPVDGRPDLSPTADTGVLRLQIGREIHEVSIVSRQPNTGKIRLAVAGFRRGSREVGFAIGRSWKPRGRVIQPLPRRAQGHDNRKNGESQDRHMTPHGLDGLDSGSWSVIRSSLPITLVM